MDKDIEKTLFAKVEKVSLPTAKELAENIMNPEYSILKKSTTILDNKNCNSWIYNEITNLEK